MWKKIKKAFKKVAQAVRSGVTQVVSIIKELVNWTIGVVDFVASLLGLQLWKKLRVSVVILRDENGPLLDLKNATDAAAIEAVIAEAERVFRKEIRVKMVPADGQYITTVATPSPAAALDVHCDGGGAWGDDFGEAGSYFRDYSTNNVGGFAIGYGAPITVFVVRNVSKKWGCSLGMSVNYVTVDIDGIQHSPFRIIAHEIGHSCNLWHRKAASNLMRKTDFGDDLFRWQQAIFRLSRHVTFL